MTEHDRKLIEALEERLLWYREEASPEEFDADEVDAICTMLLKLSPESRPRRSGEEAYQDILRRIALEEENPEGEESVETGREKPAEGKAAADGAEKRRFVSGKRALRAAVVFLAAAGVLVSLNMVSYARENKSLFTMILERAGVLKIVKDETVESVGIGSGKRTEEFYDSWAELDSEIKQKIRVPSYIPEGYSLYGIRCWGSNNREILQADYYDQGNGHLLMEITVWKDNEDHYRETLVDEQIYTLLSEYSKENIFYYEYEDEYICIVFTGDTSYRIEGNISLEEMMKIGDGI